MNDGEARESRLASGWTVEGASADTPVDGATFTESSHDLVSAASVDTAADAGVSDADAADVSGQHAQMSNATLVLLGIFGGIYLMYTWVWLSWAKYSANANDLVAASSGSLGGALQQVVFWIAPLAPIGWFLCAVLLNRGASTLRLALWIVLGAVVLAPLPMFMWGS